jgi:hypothetical protein
MCFRLGACVGVGSDIALTVAVGAMRNALLQLVLLHAIYVIPHTRMACGSPPTVHKSNYLYSCFDFTCWKKHGSCARVSCHDDGGEVMTSWSATV